MQVNIVSHLDSWIEDHPTIHLFLKIEFCDFSLEDVLNEFESDNLSQIIF